MSPEVCIEPGQSHRRAGRCGVDVRCDPVAVRVRLGRRCCRRSVSNSAARRFSWSSVVTSIRTLVLCMQSAYSDRWIAVSRFCGAQSGAVCDGAAAHGYSAGHAFPRHATGGAEPVTNSVENGPEQRRRTPVELRRLRRSERRVTESPIFLENAAAPWRTDSVEVMRTPAVDTTTARWDPLSMIGQRDGMSNRPNTATIASSQLRWCAPWVSNPEPAD